MASSRIGFLGECMIELKGKPQTGIVQGYAGDTLNTAVYFSRLVKRELCQAHYVTALGQDAFSEHMCQSWRAEGLSTRWVKKLDHKLPGIYAIETDDAGERRFHYWRNDAAAKYYFDDERYFDELSNLNGLYLSGISLAVLTEASRERLLALLRAIKANGGKIYFDNNYRPKLWRDSNEAKALYNKVLPLCDIAFLTLDDEAALFGSCSVEDVLERLQPLQISEIVIKCGADPCVIAVSSERITVTAEAVAKVVDTTAAGDSFSAAYLAARLNGCDPKAAAKHAHKLAAAVIQAPGAILPLANMPSI